MSAKNTSTSLLFLLDKVVRNGKKTFYNKLKTNGFDLTFDQWILLEIIANEKQLTQVNLAKKANKDTASITRMLDLLHSNKLVRRTPNVEDNRKSALVLTEKGKDYVKKCGLVVNDFIKKQLNVLSKKEVELLEAAMEKLASGLG